MPEQQFVPARYVGNHIVDLQQTRRDWRNIDGAPRKETRLSNGDTVMMPAEEVLGMTIWHDPQQQKPSVKVGIGRCCFPLHQGKSEDELRALGYEFHMGRTDFEAIEVEKSDKKKRNEVH